MLLAVYNGEPYLREQLDSLLAQTYAPVVITASDDGSADGSAAVLEEYAARWPGRVRVLPFERGHGSAQANFLRLMRAASHEYVCFCDQDDVWLPGKIEQSMARMEKLEREHGAGTPLLVFTDLRVVDQELRTVAPSLWKHLGLRPQSTQRLERLIGQTVVTGCTVLMNGALLALSRQMPAEATMHDRWVALLAASIGHSAWLPEATVLYRQHERNVVGARAADASMSGVAARAVDGTGRQAERLRSEQQVEALLRLHGAQMGDAPRRLLERYLESGRSKSGLRRVWLTLRDGFFRGSVAKTGALLVQLARSATLRDR